MIDFNGTQFPKDVIVFAVLVRRAVPGLGSGKKVGVN